MHPNVRIFIAEAIGTAVLVTGGCGAAVLSTGAFSDASIGVLGVALAFGLSLLIMAYAIGNISGCHINPAVTLGLWSLGKVRHALLPFYIVGQLVGASIAGAIVDVIANGRPGGFTPDVMNFAVNGWGKQSPGGFDLSAAAIVEIVMTAVFVFVVASTTHRRFSPATGGIAVGLALTVAHFVAIPVDNASINPARSFGVAIYAGGQSLSQLWAFIVFPILGAAVGALLWKVINDDSPVEIPLADASAEVPAE